MYGDLFVILGVKINVIFDFAPLNWIPC